QSKIFATTDFYYRTITVERPLRLNYAYTTERIEQALTTRAITKLDNPTQTTLRQALEDAHHDHGQQIFTQRQSFTDEFTARLDQAGIVLKPAALKAVLAELSEHDDQGELVTKRNGDPEPNTELRDIDNVPWDQDIHQYLEKEVKPFIPDAWIDETKTKEGVEIPFTRHFYQYTPPRPLADIDADLDEVLDRIRTRLQQV